MFALGQFSVENLLEREMSLQEDRPTSAVTPTPAPAASPTIFGMDQNTLIWITVIVVIALILWNMKR